MVTFRIPGEPSNQRAKTFNVPERTVEETNPSIPATAFGTSVIDNLFFDAGAYTDKDGSTIQFEGLHINQVGLSVNMTKQIVKTSIQGRNGTIKEYISDGDYVVTASGTITDDGHVFPSEAVEAFVAITKVPQQIRVVSSYLNDNFDIFWIVIESVNIGQKSGFRNEVAFNMTAVSDFVADLEEITEE